MRGFTLVAALASLSLAACGGGGGGGAAPAPVATGSGTSAQGQSEHAIAATNDVGAPLADFSRFDESVGSASIASSSIGRRAASTSGACADGVEFFVPATSGATNSTETKDFYDSACTLLARDAVRIFTPLSTSAETVAATVQLYAPLNPTPIAVHTATRTFENAVFSANGFPLFSTGFSESSVDTLSIANSKTIESGAEFVVAPTAGAVSDFCSDSAGFNATGFAKLDATFGWQGGVLSGGSRTVNADDSVTWTGTHTGFSAIGTIGALSVGTFTQNTACPITNRMFTLAGGTTLGNYTIPLTVTYLHGMVESLAINNATLANGDTLSVTTTPGTLASSNTFITGSVASGGMPIATFAVNGYGDGTLTVTASARQYVIVDWHVVR